jgi:hypothetical protein
MATSWVYRYVGPTYLMSVTNSSHAAMTVTSAGTNDQAGFAAFINVGTNAVLITVTQNTVAGAPVSVLPSDGAGNGQPGSFVLGASMDEPMVVAVPPGSFSCTAIGTAAGPSSVYINYCDPQS